MGTSIRDLLDHRTELLQLYLKLKFLTLLEVGKFYLGVEVSYLACVD